MGSGGGPEGAAAVSVPLVLLQQLEVLQEEDALAHHVHSNLLQVALLQSSVEEEEEEETISKNGGHSKSNGTYQQSKDTEKT